MHRTRKIEVKFAFILHCSFIPLVFIQGIIIIIYLFVYLEDGVLYAFGSDYWGCIGCNNELDEEVVTPYRVRFFDENPVEQVACGECHVVALTGGLFVSCGS